MNRFLLIFIPILIFSCNSDDDSPPNVTGDILQLQSIKVDATTLQLNGDNADLPRDKGILATFNQPLDKATVEPNFILKDESGQQVSLTFNFIDEDKTVSAQPETVLENNTTYTLEIGKIKAVTGEEFAGATYTFTTEQGTFSLENINLEDQDLKTTNRIFNIDHNLEVSATFSDPIAPNASFKDYISITGKAGPLNLDFNLSEDKKTLLVTPTSEVSGLARYILSISPDLPSEDGLSFTRFTKEFYTAVDSTYKFPEISDEDLLTLVQEQTFKYFWDFAHPQSGMARERNTSGNLVTTGGSGFGVMTILTGIERGFISRQEGVDRLEKIVNFLKTADRFHGVWPHWLDGNTGKVIPFSPKDDGGDLVESAFMIQGLLTVRQYLDEANVQEQALKAAITKLWEEVEWDWYTKGGENTLYWHWSPNFGWEMNHQIRGWNESLIVYVLAASSPTHPIEAQVYNEGWARNGGMANGKTFYDVHLPLGEDFGGPLFFSHYSFLGLDPRNLEDQYGNYWEQNVNHSRINQQHAAQNPRNYVGYGAASWGFTASDNHEGYSAHSPTNDLGVITPTAAISSILYTPEASVEALRHFFYLLGDKLWGAYGFYDAINPTEEWIADSYLAIDQGPIIIMIENHRTALLWNLFMSDGEIIDGLNTLGFTSY